MRTKHLLPAAILVGSMLPQFALANMPTLSPKPRTATLQGCQRWAQSQDDDAIAMWGLMESGKTSRDVGVLRLALSCLGDTPPEIVSFGSSVGVADAYCQSRPRIPLCRNRE